jgi:hypothetical protein
MTPTMAKNQSHQPMKEVKWALMEMKMPLMGKH